MMTLQVQSYPFQMQFIPIGCSINCKEGQCDDLELFIYWNYSRNGREKDVCQNAL